MLDLSLEQFRACKEGYQDRVLDQQIIGIETGFWAAYYGRSKRPKDLKTVVAEQVRAHERRDKAPVQITTTDVETFEERDRKFKARLAKVKRK